MTVSLGGLALSDDLALYGPVNGSKMLLQVQQTLGGSVVVAGLPIVSGREFVLQGSDDDGRVAGVLTKTQVDQLEAMRDTMQTVELVHHVGTYSVIITAIEVQAVAGEVDPVAATWFVGTVTLLEV